MTNISHEEGEEDDFPMSPAGTISAQNYFSSFKRSKNLFEKLSKKQRGDQPEITFLNIFREVSNQTFEKTPMFRRNAEANDALTLMWLSRVRRSAILLENFNLLPEFDGLSKDQMSWIARMSPDPKIIQQLPKIMFDLGIILIYETSIPGMKLDGAAFTSSRGTPIIALSLRYSRIDHFWFTLMHELAHVSLHIQELTTPILDDFDDMPDDLSEKQADKLALNATIERNEWRNCEAKYDLTEGAVQRFAESVSVHPAIVAGRLRKELNKFNIFSEIINEIDVRKIIWG